MRQPRTRVSICSKFKNTTRDFLQLAASMGRQHIAYTSRFADRFTAHRQQGHPNRPGPFYLLMPMNTQPAWMTAFNLEELPETQSTTLGAAEGDYLQAASWIREANRTVIKVGGGGHAAGSQLLKATRAVGRCSCAYPYRHRLRPLPSPAEYVCGWLERLAMWELCHGKCRLAYCGWTARSMQIRLLATGYPNVSRVINLNADWDDATHYNHTLALVGDVRLTLEKLNQALGSIGLDRTDWLHSYAEKENLLAGI